MTKLSLSMMLSVALLCSVFTGVVSAEPLQPRMVLIIDDMGYNLKRGQDALALPGAVTYAILPYTPYAVRFANEAHDSGREVMLHVPMANTRAKELGPGALTATMDEAALTAGLNKALDDTPHISGINNHMGSQLTSMHEPMRWVMKTLKARNLYFVDSITSVKTVGWKAARDNAVPFLKRHVFLDHLQTREFIAGQFERAKRVAHQYGFAVVIGHPYPETTAYLHEVLPELEQSGIQLVAASELIQPEVKRALTVAARERAQLADASIASAVKKAKVSEAQSENQRDTVAN